MTFASGSVDVVSYLGLGRIFTANMTGNIIFLALAIGQRDLSIALNSVIALAGFSVGAIFAGRVLGHVKPATGWPPRVTALLYGHFACMAAFSVGWVIQSGYPAGAGLYLLIALSSYGMGLQNAVARHLAVPGLSTTVVTMALTGFMMDLPALGITGPGQRRALFAVIFLFSGAAVGGTLVVFARVTPPILTAAILGAVAVAATVRFGGRPASAR
ncbi:MAG: YoaK family protein [Thermoplasmata archaeon]